MKTRNEIFIAAPAATIYSLAATTSEWPRILPHYRFVDTLSRSENEYTVHMGAKRDWIPVQWTAQQTNIPSIPEIHFTHIAGWTKGMEVVWQFTPEGGGTRVSIEHVLEFQFPFAAKWIGTHIVGGFFVHAIANATLARIKLLAEQTA